MKAGFGRAVLALALAAAAQAAAAQGASLIIGGLHAVHFEEQLLARAKLCTARFPSQAEAWRLSLEGFRTRQTPALQELQQIKRAFIAAEAARPGTEKALEGFREMAELFPQSALAPLADDQAKATCQRWRQALDVGGEAEQALPELVKAARRLHSVAAPAAPAASR
jgi:hypothetical protein